MSNSTISSRNTRRLRQLLAIPTAAVLFLGVTACTSEEESATELVQSSDNGISFEETTVVDDATGIELSTQLFESSDDVVIASASLQDQWLAAQEAVQLEAPLLVVTEDNEETNQRIEEEIERLGAQNVVRFEDNAAQAGSAEDVQAAHMALPEGEPSKINPEVAQRVAGGQHAVEVELGDSLEPGFSLQDASSLTTSSPQDALIGAVADLEVEPAYEDQPAVLVNGTTSVAEAATARARGLQLEVLQTNDPRESHTVMANPEQNILALGAGFANQEDFDTRLELAANGEINGGGGTVLPGRRMVALYGHPSGPALGALGEQPLEEAVARVTEMAQDYQQYTDEPVIPAFEIIATVAASDPGPNNNYTNFTDPAELEPWINAITEAGGYAVIDLQPGRSHFLEQAKYYEELLKNPNVGLALDPEWRIGPDELPLRRIGSVSAAEVNEVSEWLAQLVRDNNLPQKALVLHQFQLAMIEDRSQLNTDYPELSFILHADGHGSPHLKYASWAVLQQNLPDNIFMAWKNFYDEDDPTFTPEETYAINPRPWFVSYQ